MVSHFGSSPVLESELLKIVNDNFDLRPGVLMRELGLTKPIYQRTAENGHFGHAAFPWEKPKELMIGKDVQRIATRTAPDGQESIAP